MCLNPRKILNPKRSFSAAGGHRLYLTIPCGKCAECQKRKVDEYMLRAYYESLDTFKSGGFVLNDTLTYRNSDLPYISDFVDNLPEGLDRMCFSHDDFRLFFVRLRSELSRHGYEVAGHLKYFLASEYGTSEGCTHRPHYHVLFFVTFPIDPLRFSRFVSDCWQFGRTDGIPFKSPFYVRSKRLFSYSDNSDLVHLQNVVSYVTKYMCKDSKFDSIISKRCDDITAYRYGLDYMHNPLAVQFRATLYRNTSQFHRQSQGFGAVALDYLNYGDIFSSGMLSMPSRSSVVKHIPLPTYFARKLFYNLTKDFRGLPCWELNSEGLRYVDARLNKSLDLMALNLSSWFKNLGIYGSEHLRSKVDFLLAGRSFKDFARYLLFYKGRLLPQNMLNDLQIKACPSVDELLFLSRLSDHVVYLNNSDIKEIGTCVSSSGYIDSRFKSPNVNYYNSDIHIVTYQESYDSIRLPFEYYIPIRFAEYVRIHDGVPLSSFSHLFVINEKSFPCFKDFDRLFSLYTSSLIHVNLQKQSAHDLTQHLKDVHKSLSTGNLPFY